MIKFNKILKVSILGIGLALSACNTNGFNKNMLESNKKISMKEMKNKISKNDCFSVNRGNIGDFRSLVYRNNEGIIKKYSNIENYNSDLKLHNAQNTTIKCSSNANKDFYAVLMKKLEKLNSDDMNFLKIWEYYRHLSFLHSKDIVHLDIMCGNMMKDENGKMLFIDADPRIGRRNTLYTGCRINDDLEYKKIRDKLALSAALLFYIYEPDMLNALSKMGKTKEEITEIKDGNDSIVNVLFNHPLFQKAINSGNKKSLVEILYNAGFIKGIGKSFILGTTTNLIVLKSMYELLNYKAFKSEKSWMNIASGYYSSAIDSLSDKVASSSIAKWIYPIEEDFFLGSNDNY